MSPWAKCLLALAGAGCILGCSSDSPTDPRETTEEDVLLIDATVDDAGATLASSGVTIDIPAGALSDAVDIAVFRPAKPPDRGDTGSYRLSGLPAGFAQSIGLRLTLETADLLATESSAVILAEIVSVTDDGDTSRQLRILDAVAADSTLEASLPPGDYVLFPAATREDPSGLLLDIILNGHNPSGRAHVEIPLPIYVWSNDRLTTYRDLMLLWLVEDATAFLPLTEGFRNDAFPEQAAYMPLIEGTVREASYGPSRVSAQLQFNDEVAGTISPHVTWIHDPDDADLESIRQWVRFYLWNAAYAARTGLKGDWWFYATGIHLMSDISPDYVHYGQQACQSFPVAGLARSVNPDFEVREGIIPYGLGMASLARWIDRQEGEGWGREGLKATLDERSGDTYLDAGFLGRALPDAPGVWWPEYLADLLTGQLYDVDLSWFLALADETWTLDSPDDLTHTFSGIHQALDGRLYRIDLERDDFPEGDQLNLGVVDPQGEAELLVFSIDEGAASLVDRGQQVTVSNLGTLHALDEDLLVLVANGACSYERTIEVAAVLVTGAGLPDITTFDHISFEIRTDNDYTHGTHIPNELHHVQAEVAWFDNGLYTLTSADTFAVQIDPTTLQLSSWSAASYYEAIGGWNTYIRVSGGALILSEWTDSSATWRYDAGAETCSRITEYLYAKYDLDDELIHRLTGYSCRDGDASWERSNIFVLAWRSERR